MDCNYNNNSGDNNGNKWCNRCAEFYNSNGWPINYSLVQSHNQAQCRIAQQQNQSSKGNKGGKSKKGGGKKGKGNSKGKGKKGGDKKTVKKDNDKSS